MTQQEEINQLKQQLTDMAQAHHVAFEAEKSRADQLQKECAAMRDLLDRLAKAETLLVKARDIIGEVAAYGNCECDTTASFICVPCESILFGKKVDAFLAEQKDKM